MKRAAAGLLLAFGLGQPACARALAPISPGEQPAAGSTEAELWYGTSQAEKQLAEAPQIERDPALNAYLREVLCRVSGPHCADLRLYVVRNPEFNASMAPNGATLVFTGALLRMRNEAELAMVLGHEFAHFRQRHSLQQWQSTKRSSAALGTFGLLTFGAGVGLVGTAAQLAGAAGLSSYSRDAEREADQLGLQFAASQGYSPHAAIAMWNRLAEEEAATVGRRRNPVFASHPKTTERVADIQAAAEGFSQATKDLGESTYQAAIRPFLSDWLDDELARRRYSTSLVVIGNLHQTSPAEWRGTTAFYLGEAHRRRKEAGDADSATKLFAEAVQAPDAPAAAWREHGLSLRSNGDLLGARAALERYLLLAPQAQDRAFIERDLKELSP